MLKCLLVNVKSQTALSLHSPFAFKDVFIFISHKCNGLQFSIYFYL